MYIECVMKSSVRRAQICLEPWQHDRLKAMSRKTGKSISRLVRECLTQALGRPKSSGTEGPWFKFIGTGKGTGEAVAEHHDDYLYGS